MKEVCPALRMTTEQMLLRGEADCAWLYLCWEVVRAERAAKAAREAEMSEGYGEPGGGAPAGMPLLRIFRLAEYGVRFGYMNCITCTSETAAADGGRAISALLDAVAEGAAIARSDPSKAAALLAEGAGYPDDLKDLEVSWPRGGGRREGALQAEGAGHPDDLKDLEVG